MWLKDLEGKMSVKLECRGYFHLRPQWTTVRQKAGSGRNTCAHRRDKKRCGWQREVVMGKKETSIVKVTESGNPSRIKVPVGFSSSSSQNTEYLLLPFSKYVYGLARKNLKWKIGKLDFIKIRKIWKISHHLGEIFCNTLINISVEGLLFIIYKEYLKPNMKKINYPI